MERAVEVTGADERALAAAIRRLADALSPERIYLFGSRARGTATENSDYDLLVVISSSDQPRYRRAQGAYRALQGIGIPLDIVVFTSDEFARDLPTAASLPAAVAREGRVLYHAA